MVFSIHNLRFHCTEVHRASDDAVVTWSNVLSNGIRKESIGVFPTYHVLRNVKLHVFLFRQKTQQNKNAAKNVAVFTVNIMLYSVQLSCNN